MSELVFEVTQEADGGFVAECLTEGIFTQADNWEDLRRNVKEATAAYFFDSAEKPPSLRLHLVRDEVLANG
jgi:predicted RNase H-like HicB family nuclease